MNSRSRERLRTEGDHVSLNLEGCGRVLAQPAHGHKHLLKQQLAVIDPDSAYILQRVEVRGLHQGEHPAWNDKEHRNSQGPRS